MTTEPSFGLQLVCIVLAAAAVGTVLTGLRRTGVPDALLLAVLGAWTSYVGGRLVADWWAAR